MLRASWFGVRSPSLAWRNSGWGRAFHATEVVMPLEAGGRWHMRMEGKRPGSDQVSHLAQGGVVKEIRPPELLVYTFAWDDRSSVGLSESPFKENTVTVRLEERGGKTVMHFIQGPFATEGERDGHDGGWNSAFDCFAEFLLREQPARAADPNEGMTEAHLKAEDRA